MTQTTPQAIQNYLPERWLILSEFVYDAIQARAGDSDSLASMRLATGLIEYVESDEHLRGRLADIERAAKGSIVHLVYERVDRAVAEQVIHLGQRYPDAQLHDFADSPGDVLSSVAAPDEAIVEQLMARAAGRPVTALICCEEVLALAQPQAAMQPIAGLTSTARRFFGYAKQPQAAMQYIDRLRRSLAHWEHAARAFHGEAFDGMYSSSQHPLGEVLAEPDRRGARAQNRSAVPWNELLVPPPIPTRAAEPAWSNPAPMPAAIRGHAVYRGDAVHGAVMAAAGGKPALEWQGIRPSSPEADTDSDPAFEVDVKAWLAEGGTPRILIETEWSHGSRQPAWMQLQFTGAPEFVLDLLAEGGDWDTASQGIDSCSASLDDPTGELWTQLCALHAGQSPKALLLGWLPRELPGPTRS